MANEDSTLALPARWMARVASLLALLSVAGYLYVFANPTLAMRVVSENASTTLPAEIGNTQYFLLFLTGAVPLAFFIAALLVARRFFVSYVSGELFPKSSSVEISRIGKLFLTLAVSGPVIRMLAVLIITWTNPPGQKQLVLSLSTNDGLLIILSAILLMVGHILAEANRLSEDNRHII